MQKDKINYRKKTVDYRERGESQIGKINFYERNKYAEILFGTVNVIIPRIGSQ